MKYLLGVLLALSAGVSVAHNRGDIVVLLVSDGCSACQEAKSILLSHHIRFSTEQGTGIVPQLFVNGKYVGTGSNVVEYYANA